MNCTTRFHRCSSAWSTRLARRALRAGDAGSRESLLKLEARATEAPEALPKTQRTMGLATMRERAAALKARLEIASAPGQGADVTVRLSPRASALHA